MQIALVTPYLPDPLNTGGRIRVAGLARALARQGRIQLFAAITSDDEAAEAQRAGRSLEPYSRVLTHLEAAPGEVSRREGPAKCRRFPDALAEAVAAAHEAKPFDAIVLAHSYVGRAIRHVRRTTIVLDEHEVESVTLRRQLLRDRRRVLRGMLELSRWKRFERALWARADAITAARAEDVARIRTVRPDTGTHIPNGVDANLHRYTPPSRRDGNSVLFVGNMANRANEQAALVLAGEVMPRLRLRIPDIGLTIAGRSPTPAVRALECDDVRVTGTLASLVSLFSSHLIFAVPPGVESAMNLKVLEPLTCGMPLVAPPSTVRDLPLRDGVHYVAARTTEESAEAIATCLKRRLELDAMALAARRVAERYDWEIVGERFGRAVVAAVVKRRR